MNEYKQRVEKSERETGHSWEHAGQDMGGQAVFVKCSCGAEGIMGFCPLDPPGEHFTDVKILYGPVNH